MDLINKLSISYHINKFNIFKNNHLNIIYLNIQSLRNKLSEIKNLINSFDHDVHFIVLTEIFIYSSEIPVYNIPNYNAFFSARDTKGGGGVAIFVHESINCEVIFEITHELNNLILIKITETNQHILAVYRPPYSDKTKVTSFFDKIEEIIQHSRKLWIIGDFNFDLLNKSDNTIQYYQELMNSHGFLILNKVEPQFCTRHAAKTIIDHIITNIIDLPYSVAVNDVHLGDHQMILLSIKQTPILKEKKFFTKKILQYENIDINSLQLQINNTNTFQELIEICSSAIQKHTKAIQVCTSTRKHDPWITDKIRNLGRLRDKFYRLKRKHDHNLFLSEKFKFYKAEFKRQEQQSKAKFFTNELKNNDNRHVYNLMNEYVFCKTKRDNDNINLNQSTYTATDRAEVSNIFNSYFVSCIDEIIQPSNLHINDIEPLQIGSHNDTQSLLTPVDNEEILDIMHSLNKRSAVGYDGIPVRFCLYFKEIIAPKLCSLINANIKIGIFPDCLKNTILIPVYKSGDKKKVSNYRPISLLSTFSKCFESVVFNRLVNFCKLHKLISNRQFGFCSSSSTLSAVSELITDIRRNLDQKNYCACTFFDLRKAFDALCHLRLLSKLSNSGIKGVDLKLFYSYLSNRNQRVRLNDVLSDQLSMKYGVPQGSLLGPLLFLIYINETLNLTLNGKLIMFADDMALLNSDKSPSDLRLVMQSDAISINNWCEENHMKINESKTHYIIFQNRNQNMNHFLNFKLSINDIELNRVYSAKYLGLLIDHQLLFNAHINNIRSKLQTYNFLLYKLKNVLPRKIKYIIFHSYIMSHVRYLLPIWGFTAKDRLNNIHIMINKCLRNIKNLDYKCSSKLLYDSNIMPLSSLLEYDSTLMIFKINHGLMKNNFTLRKMCDIHNYNTRSASDLYSDFFRTSGGQLSPLYNSIINYNNMPDNIKTIKKICEFKIALKEYIVQKTK